MENDLVHEEGANGKSPLGEQVRASQVVDRTVRALDKARKANVLVGFVRVGFSPDYRECPPHSPVFSLARKNEWYKLGSWGAEIHSALKVNSSDLQIIKHRVSPFYSTTLEAQLRANGIERIYCSGVTTQAVVQATVREGHDRDYSMVLIEDCCCAPSAEEHRNSVQSIRRFCADVTTSERLSFS
jgi:nicotinamidase-related amidase